MSDNDNCHCTGTTKEIERNAMQSELKMHVVQSAVLLR